MPSRVTLLKAGPYAPWRRQSAFVHWTLREGEQGPQPHQVSNWLPRHMQAHGWQVPLQATAVRPPPRPVSKQHLGSMEHTGSCKGGGIHNYVKDHHKNKLVKLDCCCCSQPPTCPVCVGHSSRMFVLNFCFCHHLHFYLPFRLLARARPREKGIQAAQTLHHVGNACCSEFFFEKQCVQSTQGNRLYSSSFWAEAAVCCTTNGITSG